MMKKLLLILFCLPFIGVGQIWETELLKNNKDATFLEKKIAFENYRTKYPDKKGYNPYARMIDFLETRLDEDGRYPAYKLYNEWRKEKEKYTDSKITSSANWQPLGPFDTPISINSGSKAGQGRINTIAFDPVDTNVIWIGAPNGGLWKTSDGGINWTTNTDNLPRIGISAIAINPINPQIMYIATGDQFNSLGDNIGILRSDNGGQSWDTTGLNYSSIAISNMSAIYKILINPNNPDSIFAATDEGIMLSVNGGNNWSTSLSSVAAPSFYGFVDIEFMPGNTNVIYAVTKDFGNASPYKSIDGGANWTLIDSGLLPDRDNAEIAVTADNPNVIYALFTSSGEYHGLYKSINMGDAWTLQSDTPDIIIRQGSYNLSLAVDPTNEANVWAGGIQQNNSIDNGQNWNINYGNANTGYVHVDQHFADFNLITNTLFVANDGGIYKYLGGTNWDMISDGLEITEFYKLGLSKNNPDRLVAGSQDNGTSMLDNGLWNNIFGADGMECAIDPYDDDIIYITIQGGKFFKSFNGGSNFQNVTPISAPSPGAWVTPWKVHPLNNNMIVGGWKQVYRSLDGSATWDSLSNFAFASWQYIDELALAPSDVNYIYVSNRYIDSLFMTNDAGLSWVEKSFPIQNSYPHEVTDILVSPNNPEEIFITLGGWKKNKKVFKSMDSGDSWINISTPNGGNLPNVPVHCIVFQNNAKNDLYVGTDLGVYYRDSTMSSWMPFMTGLPNVPVTELEIHYGTGKIRASTYGRGIWESDLNTFSTSVNFQDLTSCTIYPNPTRDKINIYFPKFFHGQISVTIYSLTGDIVFAKELNSGTRSLDVSSLKAGCYFINITGEDKDSTIRKKIIKY